MAAWQTRSLSSGPSAWKGGGSAKVAMRHINTEQRRPADTNLLALGLIQERRNRRRKFPSLEALFQPFLYVGVARVTHARAQWVCAAPTSFLSVWTASHYRWREPVACQPRIHTEPSPHAAPVDRLPASLIPFPRLPSLPFRRCKRRASKGPAVGD